MSVTPADLMNLAETLVAGSDEASHRAAASRSYYAAFHLCEAVRRKLGVTLESELGSHAALIRAFERFANGNPNRVEEVRVLGRSLDKARRLRVTADYRIGENFAPIRAREAIGLGHQIQSVAARLL